MGHERALYEAEPTSDCRERLAGMLHELGAVQLGQGELGLALGYLEDAEGHQRALYEADPTPDRRERLAATQHELGIVHRRRGEDHKATRYFGEERELRAPDG